MSTQTRENGVATTGLAAPTIELGVGSPLSATLQQVLDENGNPSALYVSAGQVAVGTVTLPPVFPFVVEGDRGADALAQIRSRGRESSMEFVNLVDKAPWRVGTGGNAGSGAFFLWNGPNGVVLAVTGTTFDFRGAIKATSISTSSLALTGLKPSSAAPAGADLESVVVDRNTGTLYYV